MHFSIGVFYQCIKFQVDTFSSLEDVVRKEKKKRRCLFVKQSCLPPYCHIDTESGTVH